MFVYVYFYDFEPLPVPNIHKLKQVAPQPQLEEDLALPGTLGDVSICWLSLQGRPLIASNRNKSLVLVLIAGTHGRHSSQALIAGTHHRHSLQEALNRGYILFSGSLALIIFGSLLEAWFFWLYNGSWHPFANILKDPSDAKKCKKLCWVGPSSYSWIITFFRFHDQWC